MNIKFLDLNKQYNSIQDEISYEINKTLTTCDFINGSSKIQFETSFAKYIGTKYCLGVGNGTDALEIAIKSLNLPKNSNVLIQANTFIATAFGASHNNLKPIFVDIDPQTLMIDLNDLESKITSNTSLIIVVHLYGSSCNMNKLINICDKYNIKLIEDCAQSHGAKFNNKNLGTFGDLSCFSFYPGKNLGAYGDGGAICTNYENLFNFMKSYTNLGSLVKYHHDFYGRNSRLDTIHASILAVKLKYLNLWNEKRRQIAQKYDELLKDINHIELTKIENNVCPVYHLYVIKVKNNKRNNLQQFLKTNGIDTIIHYPIPLHKTKAYEDYNDIILTHSENASNEILSLPIYPELHSNEVEYICKIIKSFFE